MLAAGMVTSFVSAQTTSAVYAFTGAYSKSLPYGGLILSGGVLYGTTSGGGSGSTGTVFKINPDGSGKSVLHNFASFVNGPTNSDGAKPHASLLLSGSTLYGTTSAGGSSGNGTIFSVNTDGTGFTVLYTFTGGSDGANPFSSLILSGSTLYGTASLGGSGYGTVFSISTSGSGFTVLHTFTGTNGADGAYPMGGLVLSGSTLYGTAEEGGVGQGLFYDSGTVFSLSTTGTNFTVLHTFTGGTGGSDGANPVATLVLSGSTLYGTTSIEDNQEAPAATIFKVSTSGTGFTVLYSFTGGNDGANPTAPLVLSGSTLYGTASEGGSGDSGTVFSISTSGTGFTVLYGFSSTSGKPGGENSDGANPNAGLVLSGSTLYGTAVNGGTGGTGTLFSVSTNGGSFAVFHDFSTGTGGDDPVAALVLSGSTFYGTTYSGGAYGDGAVFKVNTDGSGYSTLYSFTGGNDGSSPAGTLILSGSTLYGAASIGGTNDTGTVFSINTDGSSFTVLHSFASTTNEQTNSDGIFPVAGLALSGSTLYGSAASGGVHGNGTLFSVNTNGTGFTLLHTFSAYASGTSTNSDGASPEAGLTVSGSTLYGTASEGGSKGNGTVFSVSTSGTSFTTLHNFTGGSDGANPFAGLLLSGSTLYGAAEQGGTNGTGTLFSIGTGGSGFTTLYTFSPLVSEENSDGAGPLASLILSGSTLYGTTPNGGTSGNGTAFSVSTSGTGFTTLHDFGTLSGNLGSNHYGAKPQAALILSGSVLYGTAPVGGPYSSGTVYSVTP